jgi:Tfp pilus assembly protein PilF
MVVRITSLVFLSIISAAAAQVAIAPPDLNPYPTRREEARLLSEGAALNEQGEYERAVEKYQKVLDTNPDNVTALYEISTTYYRKNDYRQSLETALRGARYKCEELPQFYLLIATNYDLLGEPARAVEVYKAAIQLMPNMVLFHYNLAVTYVNQQLYPEARGALKRAVQLDPDHPGSHFALAMAYQNSGYTTPALLAIMRFLMLEPDSEERSATGFQLLQSILQGNVRKGEHPDETNITVDMSAKKDEGDFSAIDMFIGLSRAVSITEEKREKSELQLYVEQLSSLIAMISEIAPDSRNGEFVWRYYAPYFRELGKQNLAEPFCYYIARRSNMQGVEEWLANNGDAVSDLLNWSRKYRWPQE